MGLDTPPAEIIEGPPLDAMLVVPTDGPVELRVDTHTIEVVGGKESRAKLAASIENLAADLAFGGPVARHIDVEYFPEHDFLSERSAWITVSLLALPEE